MTDKLTMPMGEYGEDTLTFAIEPEPAGNGLVLSVTAGGGEYYLYERDWLKLRDLLDAMRTTAPDDTPTGGDAEPTAPWTPTDAEIREFFIEGVDALYSLTAHPRLGNPGQAFDRWLARHGTEADRP